MNELLEKLQELQRNVDQVFKDKMDEKFIEEELKPLVDSLKAAQERGDGYSLKDIASALRIFRNVVIPAYAKQYVQQKSAVIESMLRNVK